tara:strand:- start:283 stop:1257 length:975 start_codon:yes stop_codon:yes gene_type:complete
LIITRAPLRVTLGGGGTDIPFFSRTYGANFTTAAINQHVYISINRIITNKIILKYSKSEKVDNVNEIKHPIIREALKEFNISNNIEIGSFADIRSGTGLGSSGAFTNALLYGLSKFSNKNYSKKDIAKLASYIEIDILKEPVGVQDTYSTALGGIRYFRVTKNDSVISTNLLKNNKLLTGFFKNALLINTGVTRSASTELEDTIMSKKNSKPVTKNLINSKEIGIKSFELLCKNEIENYYKLIDDQWMVKLERSPSRFHKKIDGLINEMKNHGCIAAKLIGAGGGGYILAFVKNKAKIKEYLRVNKLDYFDIDIDNEGLIYFDL